MGISDLGSLRIREAQRQILQAINEYLPSDTARYTVSEPAEPTEDSEE